MFLAIYANFWLIYSAEAFVGFGASDGDIIVGSNSTDNGTKNGTAFVVYPWYAYLTNWTYLCLCLYLTWHFFVTVAYLVQNPMPLISRPEPSFHRKIFSEFRTSSSFYKTTEYSEVMTASTESAIGNETIIPPWYLKTVWILFNIASLGSVLVTLTFFIFLWPLFKTSSIGLINLQLHGINSVIIGIELMLTAVPCRLYHFIYALIYGIAYLIFSAIFYAVGNKIPIYPGVLDWSKPGQTAFICVLLGFVFMPFLQFIFFIMYKVRMYIYRKVSDDYVSDGNERGGKFSSYTLER